MDVKYQQPEEEAVRIKRSHIMGVRLCKTFILISLIPEKYLELYIS